jgi:serine/threonine protein kinase
MFYNYYTKWKRQYNYKNDTHENYISIYYGITQDPVTKDFMIIMPYYKSGDLIHCVSNNFYNIEWTTKLFNLKTIANGLINIHSVDIIHKDLHSGNIFFDDVHWPYIGDLGISKSATESTDNYENYGIIPYMAPEIFQGQKYTKASDIYSFGMIMWESMTGRRPFWDRNHDTELIIDILDGLQPPIITNAPEGYIKLMKECWHSDPEKRPTAKVIFNKIYIIYNKEYELTYRCGNSTKIIESSDIGPVKTYHSGAIYKSRPLSGMINSAMSLRSLRNQSIDLKKVKRKLEDDLIEINNDNGMKIYQKINLDQSKRRKKLFENKITFNIIVQFDLIILLYIFF